MKLKSIAFACAAALTAGQAIAHGPSVTPDIEVFISGASAQQLTLGSIAAGMMTSMDVYYDTGTNGKDYRAYFGTVTGTGTPLDGKKLLIHNRAKGGSVWGVNPVARAESIERMALTGCGTFSATVPNYKCSGLVNDVPDAGVSDVEPAMFVGFNVASGDSELTADERAQMDVFSQNAVVMGIAATNNLPLTSLSRAQIASILAGSYSDWSQVDASLSGPIYVERRVNGSGTQASANWFFGGFPCTASALPPLPDDGSRINENSTSGGVKSNLTAHNTAGRMAIGILSTESVPGSSDGWHHISIDGIAATEANAASGAYDYFVEQTMQYRNQTVAGVPAPSAQVIVAPSYTMKDFLDLFIARAGDPTILATLPGAVALPVNYEPTSYPVGQVMKGSRLSNTCQPQQLFF